MARKGRHAEVVSYWHRWELANREALRRNGPDRCTRDLPFAGGRLLKNLGLTAVAMLALGAGVTLALAMAQDPGGKWEGEIEDPRRPGVVTVDFAAGTASLSGSAPLVF